MADTIKTKIQLDGEAEFRQQLKEINSEAKALAAEMEAVTSSFKDTDSEQSKLQATINELQKRISTQTEKVNLLSQRYGEQSQHLAELRTAMQDAITKYGENSDEAKAAATEVSKYSVEVNKTKTEMSKAQTNLNKLNRELGDNENQLNDATDASKETADGIEDVGDEADEAGEKALSFGDIIKANVIADAIVAGVKALADAFVSVAKAAAEMFTDSVTWADDIATLSTNTGIGTEKLQEYEYMAGLVDTDVETITGSMRKLTMSMKNATSGTGTAADAFAALGISVVDSNDKLRDNEDVFYDVIDALGKMENETERDALSMEIFGKSAQDLNSMISAGSEALEGYAEEAHDVGYVLTEEQIGALTQTQDAFDRLKAATDGAERQISAALAPTINNIAETVVPAVQGAIVDFIDVLNGDTSVSDWIDGVSESISDFLDDIDGKAEELTKKGGEIVSSLTSGITKNLPKLISIAGTIVSKLASGILKSLPSILQSGIDIVSELITGITQQLPELLNTGVNSVIDLANKISDPENLSKLIDSGLDLVLSLVDGIMDAIPRLIEAAPKLVGSLTTALIDNSPKLIVSGTELVVKLVRGILESLVEVRDAALKIIAEIVTAIINGDWKQVGKDIVDGLKTGLEDDLSGIATAASNLFHPFKSLKDAAPGWGADMMRGFKSGIESETDNTVNSLNKATKQMKSLIHFSRPDTGPLRDYEQWMPDFMRGLARGIDENAYLVENAMERLAENVGIGVRTRQIGAINVSINAAPGQNADDLADVVIDRITAAVNEREAVFA